MTQTLRFPNVGLGISAAGEYVTIAGRLQWVHFLGDRRGCRPADPLHRHKPARLITRFRTRPPREVVITFATACRRRAR